MKCAVEDFESLFLSPDPRIGNVEPYLGPVSPNCPNVPNTLKQIKLDLQMAFTHLGKALFDVKCRAERFKWLSLSPNLRIGEFGPYLAPVSPNWHNAPNTLKQVKLNNQMIFKLGWGLIWCEMWSWTLWITFCVTKPKNSKIWAIFGRSFHELA